MKLILNILSNAEYQDMNKIVLMKMQHILPKNMQKDKTLKLRNNNSSEHMELNKKKIVLQLWIKLQVPNIMHRIPST